MLALAATTTLSWLDFLFIFLLVLLALIATHRL
jgi:hypothetical protein